MKTASSISAQRRLTRVLGVGFVMAVVCFSPSLSGAQNTCPQNLAVAPLLTQCVTDIDADCPTLCPGPNCVDTLQEAVLAAATHSPTAQVIGVFINTVEPTNVVISAPQDLRIEQCRNAKITAGNPSAPVLRIASTAGDKSPTPGDPTIKDILINGPDFIGGSIGIQVQNNSTEIKSIRALMNRVGIVIDGSSNILNGSNAEQSTDAGIVVNGDGTTVKNNSTVVIWDGHIGSYENDTPLLGK
jgi:hypothetical protein